MRAVVVYESMFGNTRRIAEGIADGLRSTFDVEVRSVADAIARGGVVGDLIVVGAPTHAHGMSRSSTRRAAGDQAEADVALTFEPEAAAVGIRDWLGSIPRHEGRFAAAFDTRADGPPILTGSARKGIAKQLARHGYRLVTDPESFLVDRRNQLLDGEARRAAEWGEALAAMCDVVTQT